MQRAMAAQDEVLARYDRAIQLSEESVGIARDSNRLLRDILTRLGGPHAPDDDTAG